MIGRLGCLVDSVELNRPEDKHRSIFSYTYATTHCIQKLRSPLLNINHKRVLYLSTSFHRGNPNLQSENHGCIFWLGDIVIIEAVI